MNRGCRILPRPHHAELLLHSDRDHSFVKPLSPPIGRMLAGPQLDGIEDPQGLAPVLHAQLPHMVVTRPVGGARIGDWDHLFGVTGD